MRQAYIVHVMDQVLAERSVVAWNDKAVEEEEQDEQGPKVTLDNVFDLAKEQD